VGRNTRTTVGILTQSALLTIALREVTMGATKKEVACLTEEQKVALAGLLHDIGKFVQRARWGKRKRHEKWGAEWVAQKVLPRLSFLSEQQRREITDLIARHHEVQPYERDLRILKIADYLASGERVERAGEEKGDPPTETLMSVFVNLRLGNRFLPESERQRWRYPTLPLRLDESIFPQEGVTANYPNLWRQLESAWQALPDNAPTFSDFDTFVLTWLSLLRAYAWCVPSAVYQTEPDIALCDHLQVTGALAFCLTFLDEAPLERMEANPFCDEEVALLVGGDITGIQHFLFTISSKGAAKSLRGRSAYLNLLCEAVAEFVRHQLKVPPCNILYSGGGHFFLLTPLPYRERIAPLHSQILTVLLDFFGGEVAIVLDAIPLKGNDFRIDPDADRSPLSERWYQLSQQLAQHKNALWREIAIREPERVFGPFGEGGEMPTCVVCHSEKDEPASLRQRRLSRPIHLQAEEEQRKCSLCESFEELSGDIARAKFLLLRKVEGKPTGELKWHSVLQAFGFEIWLNDEAETANNYQAGDWVFRLNEADLTPIRYAGKTVPVVGFRFLPQYSPMVGNQIRDLTELAEASKGAPYYGALRMDVDSLGRLFREGLGGMLSLSRLMTLSRSLTVFFEGYLNRVCSDLDTAHGDRRLYLLYAGGDDVFAVGSWDAVLELAEKVREEFRRYVCFNPCVTLSAGVSAHHDKFPLYQAAEVAKGFLETAKNFQHDDGHEKDAFGFWGQVVDWDETQQWLRKWHDQLVKWLQGTDGQRVSRAFLFKLARIAKLSHERERELRRKREWGKAEIERRLRYDRWYWRLLYYLSKGRAELQPSLEQLQRDLAERNYLRHLQLLCRWAELSTRGR